MTASAFMQYVTLLSAEDGQELLYKLIGQQEIVVSCRDLDGFFVRWTSMISPNDTHVHV